MTAPHVTSGGSNNSSSHSPTGCTVLACTPASAVPAALMLCTTALHLLAVIAVIALCAAPVPEKHIPISNLKVLANVIIWNMELIIIDIILLKTLKL